MKLSEFNKQNNPIALREQACIYDCLNEIDLAIKEGNYDKALDRTLDLRASMLEIKKLGYLQEENKRLDEIARKLRLRGIQAGVIYRV